MKTLHITVNGRPVVETIDERMHLADFLRDKLNLTATHLRCEQGVCGACTLLIDGEPARSCITYAGLCEGADVTTLEGLEHDTVIAALREAFSAEHGLQCGFCTPGMLVTARDVITRLPEADEARVRLELSGNLCRCTGYVGIVRAIRRVLDARKAGMLTVNAAPRKSLGPVGARVPAASAAVGGSVPQPATELPGSADMGSAGAVGLGSATPNITLHQSFAVAEPPDEVWRLLSDVERVVPCMPGASLAGPVQGDCVPGRMTVKLGPITATFSGEARITRDDGARRGTIAGGGRDRFTRSRVAADLAYSVRPQTGGTGTVVDIHVRALLTGPLAQFSRSGLVEEIAARLTQVFAGNLERQMAGGGTPRADGHTALSAGSLIGGAVMARLRAWLKRIYRKPGREAGSEDEER
jgi:carbon-monoxide dehydrogenase small subunit